MLKSQAIIKKYSDLTDGYYKTESRDKSLSGSLKKPLAFVRTYGCQQNVSDGEKIKGVLSQMGYLLTDKEDKADIIIFNTCAIREHAEDRVFGNIGALKNIKKKNPSMKIIICGCMTEQEYIVDKIKKSYSFVDMVIGTNSIHRLPEFINELYLKKVKIFSHDNRDVSIYEGVPIERDSKIKAWVPVMYGCNNFCSYCIVPYVRGRERSRFSGDIILEIRDLILKGYKEITLLGQNVNSYGRDSEEKVDFSSLLKMIDNIEGDYRIRFMTSHPKDATRELIDVITQSKHICRHLHLPFQSGNNRILKEMNRKYTRESYLEIIDYAKKRAPDICLTSDIIVGFPGETYNEFKDTVSLIQEVKFTSLFTFIYSSRKGTPASGFPDPVSKEQKTLWLSELLKAQESISYDIYKNAVGQTFKVLVESKSNKGEWLNARTEGNIIIEAEGPDNLIGGFAYAKVTGFNKVCLKGVILK